MAGGRGRLSWARRSWALVAGVVAGALLSAAPAAADPAFAPPDLKAAPGGLVGGVAAADVTGDGRTDVLAPSGSGLLVYVQGQDGVLQAPRQLPLGSGGIANVAVGDLTGDGRADAVVGTPAGVALYSQSAGQLSGPAVLPGLTGVSSVAVADMNGDGRDDVLAAAGTGVFVLTSSGSGFTPSRVSAIRALQIVAADVDGDGRQDVLTCEGFLACNVNALDVFGQTAAGGFARRTVRAGTGSLAAFAVGDVTGDSRADIVMSNPWNSALEVAGGGTTDPTDFGDFSGANALAIADVDRDGRSDVVGAGRGVALHLGSAAGLSRGSTLASGVGNDLQTRPYSVAVGDVNGDGAPDVVVADLHGLLVFRQLPGQRATHPFTSTILSGPSGVTTATSATFTFSSNIAGAGYFCGLDGPPGGPCTSPATFTGIAPGRHHFSVTARNPARDSDAAPAVVSWTVANATPAPDTTIASGPDARIQTTAARLTFTSNVTDATFQCALDMEVWTACASPADVSGAAQQYHGFRVRAVAASGAADPTPAFWYWFTEGAQQNDAFAAPNRLDWRSGQDGEETNYLATKEPGEPNHAGDRGGASVWYEWNTPLNGVVTLHASNNAFRPLVAVYTGTRVDGLVEVASAAAAAGATSASVTWSAVAGKTYWIAVDGVDGGVGPFGVYWTFALGANAPPNDNFAGAATAYGDLPEQPYVDTTLATKEPGEPDHGGNRGGASVWFLWTAPHGGTIELTTVGSTFDTTVGVYTGSSLASLQQVAGNDDAASGDRSSKLVFDAVWKTTYAIAVDGHDGATGIGSLNARWVAADAPPVVTITQGPPTITYERTATLTFTSDLPDALYTCEIDGSVPVPCTSPVTYSGLSEGSHFFGVAVTGPSGQTGYATWQWGVPLERVNPETTILSGPTGTTSDTTATFTFSSDIAGATFTCQLDNGAGLPCTSPQTYSPLPAGSHSFSVRAASPTGFDQTSEVRRWTVDAPDTIAPTTSIVRAAPGGLPPTSATFMLDSNEPDATFECSLDSSPWYSCPSLYMLQNLASGPHTLAVRAKDAAGNADPTPAVAAWTVDAPPPTPPANDHFVNARAIDGTTGSVPGSTVGATLQPGEPQHAGVANVGSVWFAWTAPGAGSVALDTSGAELDTVLAVYTGTTLSALTPIASNDDSGGSTWSRVAFTATGGTTYRIAVAGSAVGRVDARLGAFSLKWTWTASPRQTCAAGEFEAQYFANMLLTGLPAATRCEPSAPSYDWRLGSPLAGVPADGFSAQWRGSVVFPAGITTFTVRADDGVRLWVDGALLINAWGDKAATAYSVPRDLTAGPHDVRLEYYENGGNAVAQLSWTNAAPPPPPPSPAGCAPQQFSAQYFTTLDLSGTAVLTRCEDGTPGYDWALGSPTADVPVDRFSARWTGRPTFAGGDTTFTVKADDGVRLWVDGSLLVDAWKDQAATTYSARVPLTAGAHDVKVEYYESGGNAVVQLSWAGPAGSAPPPSPPPSSCATGQFAAQYFAGVDLSGAPVLTRCEASAPGYDWALGGPGSGVPTDRFSARWTGRPTFAGGDTTFTVRADDGVRLWVDGALVVDAWKDQAATAYTATVPLSAGGHDVKVEYFDSGGNAVVQVSWREPASAAPAPPPPAPPPPPSSPPPTCGSGEFAAQYFASLDLAGAAVLSRCETGAPAYNWALGGPGSGVPNDGFSARWTGRPTFAAGSTVFTVRADDGVRLWVDGTLVVDAWKDQAATAYTATVPLTAGSHEVKLEFFDSGGNAVASVSWAGP
jgi:RNase P/RNase MRP subunit p29